MTRIELRTLGHADLTAGDGRDGSALLAQPKRFALFCYFAPPSPGTLHRRDTLIGVFWPEVDQEHARMNLRQALAFIRRVLGEDVLINRGAEEVGLNPDRVWCDAAAFQDAVKQGNWADAVELYRGEFLKGFFLSNGPEFERWLDGERARLASAYGSALERAADRATAEGETRTALEYCERLVEHDRYNSRYAMRLMQALAAAGDPANALMYAERHRELLDQELDIAPPGEFETLVEQLRAPTSVVDVEPPVETPPKPAAERVRERTASAAADLSAPIRTAARTLRRIPWWAFAPASIGILLVGIVLGVWVLTPGNTAEKAARPTVAVLDLTNLGAPEDSVFALGVTDALVTRLTNIGDARVATGGGAFSDGDLDLAFISDRLGASHVLKGTLQREHPDDPMSTVRISVQLLDVTDGTYLWANAFETDLAGVFRVYDDIGEQVARALNVTLLEEERRALDHVPTDNPQAYEYYLLGNAYFEQGFPIRWELRSAVEMYERAIEADSGFALAYVRLSMAHAGIFNGGLDRSDERVAKWEAAIDEALRLDPNLPEAHVALGLYHQWAHGDYERALAELELARQGLADDYWYRYRRARVEHLMGNFPEAARGYAAASDLRPLAFAPAMQAGQTYRVLRRYEEAHRYLDRYMATTPSRPYAYLRKALAYLEEEGDVARAREVLQSGPAELPYDVMIAEAALDYCMPGWFRLLRVLCGDCRQAVEHMQLKEREFWHYYLGKALLYGRMGEHQRQRIYNDSAAAILEELIEGRPDGAHLHADLGLTHAALGRKEPALREARLAVSLVPLSRNPWDGGGVLRKLAEVYSMFGEADSAAAQIELLLSGFAAGEESGHYVNPMSSVPLMRIDPIWDPIRDHPAFQALLAEYDPLR